jgi:hypothetical protein
VNGCCLTPKEKKFSYAMARTSYLIRRDDDDVRFVQDHHAFFHLYSAISLTQHVSPVGHIILIPSQQDFDFFFYLFNAAAKRRSNKYQFYSLSFDPTVARTHDLPHSIRKR